MKRVVRSYQYVQAMSVRRSDAIKSLDSLSEALKNHVVKCVIYGKSLGESTYEHWIDEISEYLSIANDITIKPSSKKLKKDNYKNALFGAFGETLNDASIIVRVFRVTEGKNYPDFETSDNLYQRIYTAFQDLMNKTLPILITNNSKSKADFRRIVEEILNT